MNSLLVWGVQPPQLRAQTDSTGKAGHPGRFSKRELAGLLLLLVVVFATRWPWLSTGYGIDPDCSRVIVAARHIASTGEYMASRGPSYPLHEYMVAAVVRGGPTFTNGISALFGCVAVLFLALILRRLQVRSYLVMSLAFALVPVVFVNCTSTIDYIPALAFILMSTYFTLAGRPLLAGVCLGLAIGTRLTSGAMLLPLILWTWLEGVGRARLRDAAMLCAFTLAIGCLAYLPPFLKHGIAFVAFIDWESYPEFAMVLHLGANGVWGYSPRTVAAAFTFLFFLGSLLTLQRGLSRSSRHALVASGLAVVIYTVAYLRLPYEAGYLIPAVPFVLLAMSLLYPASWLRAAGIALAVAFLVAPGEHGPSRSWAIRQDHRLRIEREAMTERIIASVSQLPSGSVVVVAWELPQLMTQLDRNVPDPNPYLYFIRSTEEYRQYEQSGRQVYYLKGLDWHNLHANGVDIASLGARELSLVDSVTVAVSGP